VGIHAGCTCLMFLLSICPLFPSCILLSRTMRPKSLINILISLSKSCFSIVLVLVLVLAYMCPRCTIQPFLQLDSRDIYTILICSVLNCPCTLIDLEVPRASISFNSVLKVRTSMACEFPLHAACVMQTRPLGVHAALFLSQGRNKRTLQTNSLTEKQYGYT